MSILSHAGDGKFLIDIDHMQAEYSPWSRDAAKTVSRIQHEEAIDKLTTYKKWFLDEIMEVHRCNAMVIIPITKQEVDYREDPPAYYFYVLHFVLLLTS